MTIFSFTSHKQNTFSPLTIALNTIQNYKTQLQIQGYLPNTQEEVGPFLYHSTAMGNLTCSANSNQIEGIVFEDFNYNGIYDSGDYLGVSNITISITDNIGNNFTSTTDANGAYSISGLVAGRTYRVAFSNLPAWASPTFLGDDSGTTVQFVDAGNCANLGLATSAGYCQENPLIAIPCYVNGDPLAGGTSGTQEWMVYFRNDNQGTIGSGGYTSPEVYVDGQVIGATWGVAHHRQTKTVLASAVMKRHVGFGQNGTGAIYQLDANGNPTLFIDLNTYTNVNTGADTRGGTNNTLPADFNVANRDIDAFQAVGKVGLGDIELSDDEQYLYAINLHERTLVEMYVGDNLSVPTMVNTYNIATAIDNLLSGTAIACGSAADYRPWGLKYHRGLLYVGVVCSAEISRNTSDLHAYVLSFDPTHPNNGFSQVINMPLDYAREAAFQSDNPSTTIPGAWRPWALGYNSSDVTIISWRGGAHPSPILADIEIDDDGSMILGFMDRFGMQSGYRQLTTDLSDSNADHQGMSAGDIIRFCNINGNLVREGSAGCAYNTSPPWTNPPSDLTYEDEFYAEEEYFTTITNPSHGHPETTLGSLAFLPGSGEIVSNTYDPFSLRSGGVAWYSNTDGSANKKYELYESINASTPDGSFSKATALGDMEFLCDPAPIQIGNFVWEDTDKDGIQDADELGIAGVAIHLYKGKTLIAETTTDLHGQYYFSDKNAADPNLTWSGTDVDTTLIPNRYYQLVIGLGQYANETLTISGDTYTLTTTSTGNNNDLDNDASNKTFSNSTYPVVGVYTKNIGQVFHRYDVGFAPPECSLEITGSNYINCTDNNDGTYTTTWDINLTAKHTNETQVSYQYNNESIQTLTLSANQGNFQIAVPADGAANDEIKVYFSNDTVCGDTLISKRPTPCVAPVGTPNTRAGQICNQLSGTDIGGVVFEDYDYEGSMNQGDTVGVNGVQVILTDDCNNSTQMTSTDANGNYLFSGLTANTRYRIEFVLPESVACWAKPSRAGADNGTTVQFVEAGNCASLGVADPNDYCETTPTLMTSCYVQGDQVNGEHANDDVLVGFGYDASGQRGTAGYPEVDHVALAHQIGTTFGLAYNKPSNTLLAASYYKYRTGFGPAGQDAIYYIIPGPDKIYGTPDDEIDTFIEFDDIFGANSTGPDPFAVNPNFEFGDSTLVTEVSFGDIEFSKDFTKLHVMNLGDRKVYTIPVSGDPLTPDLNNITVSPVIPTRSGCSNILRPFALAPDRDGKVYVGATCQATTRRHYVWGYDPITNLWDEAPAFEHLTSHYSGFCCFGEWNSTNYNIPVILAGLEIDARGDLIIALRSRATETRAVRNIGDIFRACANGSGGWEYENNGTCGIYTGHGVDNNRGHGRGEFFNDQSADGHNRSIMGGLGLIPGRSEVVATFDDPYQVYTGGILWSDITNGQQNQTYEILRVNPDPTDINGKVAILGEVQAVCNATPPLEIGNRVWEDVDRDGIQDACEDGMMGIAVSLYKNDTKIAETQTDVIGQYYFSDKNATDINLNWTGINADTALIPNTNYQIVFGESQYATGILSYNANTYNLTLHDQGNNNQIDSDATEVNINGSNYPTITATTGIAGCADHSYDVGFVNSCAIEIVSLEQHCNDNNTGGIETDDYIEFTINVSNTNPGVNNQFQVVHNTEVIATGNYGTPVILDYQDLAKTSRFIADNMQVYNFTVRDFNTPTCTDDVSSTPVENCSDCPIEICIPVIINKKLGDGSGL